MPISSIPLTLPSAAAYDIMFLFRYSLVVTVDLVKTDYSFPQIKQLAEKIMAVHSAHITLETAYVAYSRDLSITLITIVGLESTVGVEENKVKL